MRNPWQYLKTRFAAMSIFGFHFNKQERKPKDKLEREKIPVSFRHYRYFRGKKMRAKTLQKSWFGTFSPCKPIRTWR